MKVRSPTRKPGVMGHPFRIRIWRPGHPSRLLLPDGALLLLEERAVRPGIADGYFWRKLHHARLAGRLGPSSIPIDPRFRESGPNAPAPPLLQPGRQL